MKFAYSNQKSTGWRCNYFFVLRGKSPGGTKKLSWNIDKFKDKESVGKLFFFRLVKNAQMQGAEGFLFGGLSPPNKKMNSLRPLRLCGENLIWTRK